MKTSQKGSVGTWVILIIVLIMVGAGVYLYTQHNTQSESSTTVSDQTDSLTQTTSAGSNSGIVNCGTAVNANSSDSVQQQKNEAAYACMSKAIATCGQANLVAQDAAGTMNTFSIAQGNNLYCPVTKTNNTGPEKMTCNVPVSFISDTGQFLSTKNHSDQLFYAIPLFFVPSSTPASQRPIIKDPVSGQTVQVSCTQG